MLSQFVFLLASVYGEGVYGEGLYSADAASGGGSSGSGGSGGLADTGVAIIAVATAACLLIFVTLLVRHIGKNKRSGSKKPSGKK